jgi:hypothetical protein
MAGASVAAGLAGAWVAAGFSIAAVAGAPHALRIMAVNIRNKAGKWKRVFMVFSF